ncbi:hypothetical protein [Thermospira aquatica]|uniref:DUF3996 domain-containing protein n=1 Tax=Thermospira aquatica TaxID=2828656 RepID=A0AAX3BF93_9SPIR|nr:hypothetical protein [Thermospira aquatica]URA10803.1 hypothetical protein KDW03_03080 [Thermospira aquatica]
MMQKAMVIFLFLPLLMWGEASFSVGMGGNVKYIPGSYMLDTVDNWKAILFPHFVAAGGHLQAEVTLDEIWVFMMRGGAFWPSDKVVGFFFEPLLRWYGNGTAPEEVSVGVGFLYLQIERYLCVYPEITASYKWTFGRFFVEPELGAYFTYFDGTLGLRLHLTTGFLF